MRYQPDPTDLTDLLATRVDRMSRGMGRTSRVWEQVAGRYLARHCIPSSLRDGVLRVRCSTAIWTTELLHVRAELIPRLNARLGTDAVREIAPYTGRVHSAAEARVEPSRPRIPPPPRSDIERAQHLAASIDDPDLRARALRAMTASVAVQRARERGELQPGDHAAGNPPA